MKRTISIAFLAFAAAVHAQTFTTVSFASTVAGSSAAFSSAGDSYTATLTGFTLGPSSVGDIAWIFDFDSTPVPAYNAVTIEIGGTITNGTIDIIGNEKVFDMSGPSPVEVANGTILGTFGGSTTTPFTLIQTFTFSQAVTLGQAQKDVLHITSQSGTATVDYIKQSFTPVPEPATFAALGLGAAALLRRRRK